MNGIYIHVPFCVKKCGYCDFYSVTDLGLTDLFVTALVLEIKRVAQTIPQAERLTDSVYLGGGTPSLLTMAQLETLLETVNICYTLAPGTEITVEMNPGTVAVRNLETMKSLGVNRLSVGVQSFQEDHLRFLGRIHTAGEAEHVLQSAMAKGFDNVGIDIIHGLPGQDVKNLEKDLEKALRYDPAHLSCYMLSYEEGTPLYRARRKKEFKPLSESKGALLFNHTIDILEKAGYHHYEISNFSRTPGTRSRHNMKYWNFEPYQGFGPSAHAYDPKVPKRSWNVRNLETYLKHIQRGEAPEEGRENLSRTQQITEAVFLSLRMREGLDIKKFNARFLADFRADFEDPLSRLRDSHLLDSDDNRVFLTRKGLLFADHVASVLLSEF